ncbi:MAG: hypothetical protein ACFFC7_01985 [Candidatus Hermodarchaeota archaeon]
MEKEMFKEVETFSVNTGEPLFQLPLRSDLLEQQQKLYDQALKEFNADPDNP